MPTVREVSSAENRLVEAAASLLSFLEDMRAGEHAGNDRHVQLVEELKAATDEYGKIILRLRS